MSISTATSYLAANLASLGERNAHLGEALAAVSPRIDLLFASTPQGVPTATLEGKQLCSRHNPIEEAQRQTEAIDLVEHAVVVVMGFGLGYHVQKIAERSAKATLIVVFEPDLALLRSVLEHIDHSAWMKDALVLFIIDAQDRGTLATKLNGAESILAQGVHFLEHPASRARLREETVQFTTLFTEFITAAKTTLMTTLMRSVDTTRNLMLNLDHYAGGAGVLELCDIAKGQPAIVVSAGPSLYKNIHLLKQQGVRERCVIIAVQTTLKPLLAAGIKPHFVTALDYHEISRRFYEDLNPDDLKDVTLIADPKAHPVILDAFPGPVRCCSNGFLDQLLGPLKREMGHLPAGATVAHLALYFAKYLGCNPIAMIGQDLGFTDGLYYAQSPGLAVHDVWAPELNPFNTIEMMEWQRIVRHRLHLHKTKDVHGKTIYSDVQMHTYLQQFERDFAHFKREGLAIIDATEGGVVKQCTVAMPLADFIGNLNSGGTLRSIPLPAQLDVPQLNQARRRIAEVRGEVHRLREISRNTSESLREMIADQNDMAKMSRLFQKVEQNRKEVERRIETFELLNHLNQLGVFNRMKADRRLHMQANLAPLAKQRAQLERDLANVVWIADAATEMLEQLELSDHLLSGNASKAVESRRATHTPTVDLAQSTRKSESRIAALIAIDPDRNGLGVARSLAETIGGKSMLQATLERLGASKRLHSIILICPREFDVESLIRRESIGVAVEIELVEGSPFGPERRAIATARLWADTCWRGGIAGMSIYDEALCPHTMHRVMQSHGLSAALIVAPDWPLIHVTGRGGCDDVIARHLEHPAQHNLVFTQSPPGLCGCVISASLMQELSQRNRLSTVGGLLVYQPHAPQGDPIARDANVQIEHGIRNIQRRFTFDSKRQRQFLFEDVRADCIVGEIARRASHPATTPQHIIIELCTNRTSRGIFAKHPAGPISRPPMTVELAQRIFAQLSQLGVDDLAVTFAGVGDPLLHPHFDQIIHLARSHNVCGIHIRTELLSERPVLDRLLSSDVDVVSVDLNADRAATYEKVMGIDRFKDVLLNIEYMLQQRCRLTDHAGTAAFAMPWVVPHLQRRSETYEDIDSFFDRWQSMLGCAVIEGIPPFDTDPELSQAMTPKQAIERGQRKTMMILCDGSVPHDKWDWPGTKVAGNVATSSIADIWKRLQI